MTTKESFAQYESEHIKKYLGRKLYVFNPDRLPLKSLPVIYGFNNGGREGFMYAELIAHDGVYLGGHVCSSEAYMPADLGCLEGTREDRHKLFKEHYPNGYRMEFVGYEELKSHAGIQKAIENAKKLSSSPQPSMTDQTNE